jgi:hypothetical protein
MVRQLPNVAWEANSYHNAPVLRMEGSNEHLS